VLVREALLLERDDPPRILAARLPVEELVDPLGPPSPLCLGEVPLLGVLPSPVGDRLIQK